MSTTISGDPPQNPEKNGQHPSITHKHPSKSHNLDQIHLFTNEVPCRPNSRRNCLRFQRAAAPMTVSMPDVSTSRVGLLPPRPVAQSWRSSNSGARRVAHIRLLLANVGGSSAFTSTAVLFPQLELPLSLCEFCQQLLAILLRALRPHAFDL
jgi:hypothetical protein